MKKPTVLLISGFLFAFVHSSSSFADNSDSNISIQNAADWVITHLYFSHVSKNEWGEDYLGVEVLEKGDTLSLSGIECGKYDIKMIDEDGDECIIENAAFCGEHGSQYEISSEDLLGCEGYGA